MTRLCTDDISDISDSLDIFDKALAARTGRCLQAVAAHAVGINPDKAADLAQGLRFGVVPVSGGQGLIEGFSETVANILAHLELRAFVTAHADAAGMAEAFERGADVVFLSDDERFVALNLLTRQVVDNGDATGRGFAAGLDLMCGGLLGRKVLVLGCGPVGRAAVRALLDFGADVTVYDIDRSRSHQLADQMAHLPDRRIEAADNFSHCLARHHLVMDATTAAAVIEDAWIGPECYVAAPGMPLGLTHEGVQKIAERLLHDPLQTGVATMALAAIKLLSP